MKFNIYYGRGEDFSKQELIDSLDNIEQAENFLFDYILYIYLLFNADSNAASSVAIFASKADIFALSESFSIDMFSCLFWYASHSDVTAVFI